MLLATYYNSNSLSTPYLYLKMASTQQQPSSKSSIFTSHITPKSEQPNDRKAPNPPKQAAPAIKAKQSKKLGWECHVCGVRRIVYYIDRDATKTLICPGRVPGLLPNASTPCRHIKCDDCVMDGVETTMADTGKEILG
jgi:hypothetical protein